MAIVIDKDRNDFLLCFSPPESDWIKELAKGMGITKEAVVGAAVNKGLTYYIHQFGQAEITSKIKDLAEGENNKPTSDAKDHKTYDKGSCQG